MLTPQSRVLSNQAAKVTKEKKPKLLFPGEKFDVAVSIFDAFGQSVTDFRNLALKVSTDGNSTLKGSSFEQSLRNGEVIFKDLVLVGKTGTSTKVIISASTLKNTIEVPVQFSECHDGYYEEDEGEGKISCTECHKGSYSLGFGVKECKECPSSTKAKCPGGKVVTSRQHFWAVENHEKGKISVYSCPNGKCLGNNTCSDVRDLSMPLCGACEKGYSEWSGNCVKCSGVNAFYFVFYFLLQGIMFISTHSGSQKPKSGAMKILFFYTQIVTVILGSNTELSFMKIFNFDVPFQQTEPSTGNDGFSTFKNKLLAFTNTLTACPFQRSSYTKLIMNYFKPLTLFLFLFTTMALFMALYCCIYNSVCCICLRCICKKKKNNNEENIQEDVDEELEDTNYQEHVDTKEEPEEGKKEVGFSEMEESSEEDLLDESSKVSAFGRIWKIIKLKTWETYKTFFQVKSYSLTLSNLLIITYQPMVFGTLAFFSCRKMDGKWYNLTATDIQCFSSTYMKWSPLYMIMLGYILFFPFVLFIAMIIAKCCGWLKRGRFFGKYFGAFYASYRNKYFWYESVALLRRTLIAMIVVINEFTQISSGQEYLYLAGFLLLLFVVQRYTKPYKSVAENTSEEVSLGSLMLVAFIRGSHTYEVAHSATTMLLLVLIILTLVFLVVPVIQGTAIGLIITIALRKIKGCCCCCLQKKKKEKGYDELRDENFLDEASVPFTESFNNDEMTALDMGDVDEFDVDEIVEELVEE